MGLSGNRRPVDYLHLRVRLYCWSGNLFSDLRAVFDAVESEDHRSRASCVQREQHLRQRDDELSAQRHSLGLGSKSVLFLGGIVPDLCDLGILPPTRAEGP